MIKKIVQKMDLLAQKDPLEGTRTNNTFCLDISYDIMVP
jgi:hypothetical protein